MQTNQPMPATQYSPIHPTEVLHVDKYNQQKGSLKGYECKICMNKGHTAVIGENGFMCMRTCKCMAMRKTIANAKASGAWELIQNKKFENFEASEAWQKTLFESVQMYAGLEIKPWLFLGGQTGAGKTHLTTAAFATILRHGVQGIYLVWPSEESRLNGAGFAKAEQVESRINELTSTPVLYIDDLFKTNDYDLWGKREGRELPSKAETDLAFEIINIRYNRQLTTLISSEFTLPEIAKFNSAIAGRIKEMCKGYDFDIGAEDSRNYRVKL